MNEIKWTLGDQIVQISSPPFVKHVLAPQNEFGMQIWEKFPNNPVIFFESVPYDMGIVDIWDDFIISSTVFLAFYTGCFFNWYPPKKLKYVKPRLGESTLT